ncbi:hypothetical protein [Winogradskyella sp.]|uniref:hypothetical protein n=1 Tax=Winogradskyella sp. TaxID=1883156 RepID=UPI00262925D5|nr:hypothetical protein [Winogradskyella sp.]
MKNFGLFILGAIIGALTVYFICCKDDSSIKGISKSAVPNGLITPLEATALDQAYDLRHSIISDSLLKNTETGDNRSSWYPIADIRSYLEYAEQQADSLGYILDGLRIYAGAYPDTKEGPGLMTMFFIPTGTRNTAQGSMFSLLQGGSNDIGGANGLNMGGQGDPPGAKYPQ